MRPGNNEYELHSKKTETYFRQHGITFQKALADSVEALTTSKDVKFRGPSKSYFRANLMALFLTFWSHFMIQVCISSFRLL